MHAPNRSWGFERATLEPSPELAEVVEEIWLLRWSDPAQAGARKIHAPPDVCVHLLCRSFAGAHGVRLEVRGPTVSSEQKQSSGAAETIGVRLRAGMGRRILGLAMEELVDRLVPFAHEHPELDALEDAADSRARVAILERFLLARHRAAPPLDSRVSAYLVRGDRGTLSDRHLRRLLKRETGLTQKQLARVTRFHATYEKLGNHTACANLAGLAQDLGYADQAHFAREFKTQTTLSPGAWVARGSGACPFSSRPDELEPRSSKRVRPRFSRNTR